MKPLTLRTYFVLSVSAVTLLLSVTFVAVFTTRFRSYCLEEMVSYGETTSKHISFPICDYLVTENYAALQQYVAEITLRPNIEAVIVFNPAGTVLTASEVVHVGAPVASLPSGSGGTGTTNGDSCSVDFGRQETIIVTSPIAVQGRDYGYSRVYVSTKAMQKQTSKLLRYGLFMGGAAWLLSVCIAIPGSALVTRPLGKLVERLGGVAQGDFSPVPGGPGIFELSRLAKTFNLMSSAIETRELELSRHRNNLETLVRERTEELQEAQQKLVATERLTLLGQFAGSLSHEIRNPLAAVSNSVYLLRHSLDEDDERNRFCVSMMEGKIAEITDIIDSILRLSRSEKTERSCVDLGSALGEAVEEFGLPPTISLEWGRRNGTIFVKGDEKQIKIAAKNVIKNAVQAIEGEGVISLNLVPFVEDGEEKVEITFSDTGEGMKNGEPARIFDPLYTTKTYGLGYGLCIVKMIAEQHGGSVRAFANEDRGMTLAIRLPQCDCCGKEN